MSSKQESTIVSPLDAQVGGDGDIGGIAHTVTSDDVMAILHSQESLESRREQLLALHDQFEARANADRGEEMDPILDEIERALAALDAAPATSATRTALGMDLEARSDTQPPHLPEEEEE